MVVVIFSLQTLEFWPNFYTVWLSDLILQNIEILAVFLQALELWSYPWKRWNSGSIFIHIGILILPLQIILVFYPYFYTHRNSDLILPNIGIQNSIIVIWALFFQTLEFLSHSFTANIEILAPSFEKCEFWFVCFFKHRNSYLSFQTLEFWPYVLYTLAVWSYYSKPWNCCPFYTH